MTPQLWIWIGFGAFVLAMLALDLGVLHRKSHSVGMKEALAWSGAWVALALVFGASVRYRRGHDDVTIRKVKQQITVASAARREACALLEKAKQAVEFVIEKDEAAGMVVLKG